MSMAIQHEQTPILRCDIYPSLAIRAAGGDQLDRLAVVAASLQAFVDKRCRDDLQGYVWQREAPQFGVARAAKDASKPARVTVSMRHGGSVEDEWLAVHLLMLASESDEFSEVAILAALKDGDERASAPTPSSTSPGLIISSPIDEDGDLVLIEAADVLPTWIQPSNAGGRLWLLEGDFVTIAPESRPGHDNDSEDSPSDAAAGHPVDHSAAIETLFQRLPHFASPPTTTSIICKTVKAHRMPSYPSLSWARDTQHTALAYLPIVAAKIVARYPQVVADAAEAFSSRDGPTDARKLRDLTVFGPPSATDSSFLCRVRLPKRMYAALLADQYFPPKVFGAPWRDAVMQYRDAVERGRGKDDTDEQRKLKNEGRRRDLGCKITCGLELAFANVKDRQRHQPRSIFAVSEGDDSDAIRSSPVYIRFVQSLTTLGFFRSELRDSYEWKQRERMAMSLWREQVNSRGDADGDRRCDDDHDDGASDKTRRLKFLLDAVPSCARDRSLPPHVDRVHAQEDPDDFLDDMPETPTISGEGNGEAEAERAAMQQISAFSDKLNTFVEGQGDEAGALFDDEGMDGAGDHESDDADESNGNDANERNEARERVAMLSAEEKSRLLADIVPRFRGSWGAHGEERDETVAEASTAAARPPLAGFSRTVKYDGASDSDESIDDEVLRAGETDADRLSRARWLDMEADLRQDEARRRMAAEDGDLDGAEWDVDDGGGDDAASGLGQDDVMGFVEFTRKELGLTTEQFNDILEQRRLRGAYVPDLTGASWPSAKLPKHTGTASVVDDCAAAACDSDEEMNDLSAQDAELLERMLHSGPPASLQVLLQKQNDPAAPALTSIEQRVLDGMLRSYEAQMGGAGPVGSLVGRFGLGRLPLNKDVVEERRRHDQSEDPSTEA